MLNASVSPPRLSTLVLLTGLSVLSLAIIRDTATEQEAASRIGYVTMAMTVAPMLGPMFGGALDELFGWRSNFVVFSGVGLAVLVLCWFDLDKTNRTPSETFSKQFQAYPVLFRLPISYSHPFTVLSVSTDYY